MSDLARLLTTADTMKLSMQSGISVERLAALAQGAEPTLGELRRVAAGLGVPLEELVAPSGSAQGAQFLFRNVGESVKGTNIVDRLTRKIGYSLDIMSGAQQTEWLEVFKVPDQSFAEAEEAATLFRAMFYQNDQVSPLLDLPHVMADSLGVILFVINAHEIDGASVYFQGTPFVFVSARFPPRMLFTVGHELGHLIAHRRTGDGFAVVDSRVDEFIGSAAQGTQERFAHTFASCLLMPKTGVGIALKKVRALAQVPDGPVADIQLLYLSRIFGVSFEAAARRCEDLDLLPSGGGASLNKQLKVRYGSAEKAADALGLPPRPEIRFPHVSTHLLSAAVERIRTGELSAGKAASILGISIAELISANAPHTH